MMAAICALTSLFPSVGATLVRIEVSARTEKHSRTTHPVASSSRCTLKTQRSSGSREATEATTSTSLCRQPSSNHAASEPRAAAPQRKPRRRVVTQSVPDSWPSTASRYVRKPGCEATSMVMPCTDTRSKDSAGYSPRWYSMLRAAGA